MSDPNALKLNPTHMWARTCTHIRTRLFEREDKKTSAMDLSVSVLDRCLSANSVS